jgi:hypothetical protein
MSSKGKGFKPLVLGLLMSEEEKEGLIRERLAEEVQRLNTLADSMGIPKSDSRWFQLALELAQLYVPELKTSRAEGPQKKWDEEAKLVLARLVARRMRQKGLNKAQACADLAEDDHWLSNIRGKPDGEAIARQCNSQSLKAALSDRDEAEQEGKIEHFDALLDEARHLMNEIETERSSA